jgi:hypothetical protein
VKKDKPSKPKNPFHKLGEDEVKIIIEKAREEIEKIKTCQSEFEDDMKKDGRSLSSKKLDRLKGLMNRAIMGVRRIGHWFKAFKATRRISKKLYDGFYPEKNW